jgi:excisionase family DNA binding protein
VAEKEFLSFEEALHELRLKEEELKRLVSEGEIRAFRDGETMKLRKSDVENLRSELSGGEVVDLGNASEELVFEDDTDLDAGMATEEISEADTLLEEDVEDVGEVVIEKETIRATPARRGSSVATARAKVVAVEEGDEGGLIKAVLLVTAIVLILALPVTLATSSGQIGGVAQSIAGIFSKDVAAK